MNSCLAKLSTAFKNCVLSTSLNFWKNLWDKYIYTKRHARTLQHHTMTVFLSAHGIVDYEKLVLYKSADK